MPSFGNNFIRSSGPSDTLNKWPTELNEAQDIALTDLIWRYVEKQNHLRKYDSHLETLVRITKHKTLDSNGGFSS